ncbi:hypothetical protein V6768_19125 [Tistrella mobilis]
MSSALIRMALAIVVLLALPSLAAAACPYITREHVRRDGGGTNAYAEGAMICAGDQRLLCIAGGRWERSGSCTAEEEKRLSPCRLEWPRGTGIKDCDPARIQSYEDVMREVAARKKEAAAGTAPPRDEPATPSGGAVSTPAANAMPPASSGAPPAAGLCGMLGTCD